MLFRKDTTGQSGCFIAKEAPPPRVVLLWEQDWFRLFLFYRVLTLMEREEQDVQDVMALSSMFTRNYLQVMLKPLRSSHVAERGTQ